MDLSAPLAPPTKTWLPRIAPLVFLATVACIAWRITRGVDLTDESYYAVFIAEWLREGIAKSPFLMLHQVSALLVYPAALAYRAIVGSSAGLVFFLRCLYLLGSVIAALAVVQFLRRAGSGPVRWLAGALLVAFVPYGTPAPSYNTMGCQALLVACATFASAVLASERRQRTSVLLVLSAVSWALAVLAYPSLLLPLGALLVCMLLVVRPARAFSLAYLTLVVVAQGIAGVLVLAVFGWPRLAASFLYQSVASSTFDGQSLLARLAALLPRSPGFALIVLLAVALGVFRKRIPRQAAAMAEALLVFAVSCGQPGFFIASHDAVLVAALGGLGLCAGLRRSAEPRARLLAVLYVVSWIAALGLAAAASLALYKIPLGVLLGAVVALTVTADHADAPWPSRLAVAPAAMALAVFLTVSLRSYYPEAPMAKDTHRIRLTDGAFAGLAATPQDASLLKTAKMALARHERPNDTLAVLGPFPGLYLLGHAPVRALSPYPLLPGIQAAARTRAHAYYAKAENRPTLLLVCRFPHATVVSPFDPDLHRWYRLQASYPTPYGLLDIYRRSDG